MSDEGTGSGRGAQGDAPVPDAAEAAFRTLRAKMSPKSRKILDRLDAVEAVYVRCGRDTLLDESFDTFLEKYQTFKKHRRKHANVFFLTGQSGAGKTEAAERMLREHPMLEPEKTSYGTIQRYVSISMSGYVIPRIVAENIMTAAGHNFGRTGRGDAWNQLPDALRKRGVCLVHIDETQHLVKDSPEQNRELANAIKGVSNSPVWPVAFVLSGLPGILDLPVYDNQVERRFRWVDFPDLDMDRERMLVVRILRELTEAIGMSIGTMPDTDMPERMAHAANYRYARVCEGVVAAIHQALRINPDATELTRDHFARAFTNQSRAPGVNAHNPFLVDDWASLPAGSFLGVRPKDGP